MDMKERIRALARAHGFDAAGFAPARLPDGAGADLREFLALGYHGAMGWMEARAAERASPDALWPEAQSVVVLGLSYCPPENPLPLLARREVGVISAYARGDDYHEVFKKKLKAFARVLAAEEGCGVKVFVDTAPVMEKPLAAQTAVGWQGKHTCVVSRQHGGWLFLGEVFTTLPIAPDAPHPHHCGSCTRCIDICPTGAILAPGRLDARRCISYLTIEHKGPIPSEFREAIGNRVYGCDDCIAVCPWNSFAATAREAAFHPRPELEAPLLADLVMLDDAAFRALFRRNAARRIGRDRFVRNVLIAIGNSGDGAYVPQVRDRLSDPSPLVRGAAVWALARLVEEPQWRTIKAAFLCRETDADVKAEWAAR